jgi:hypothetical protein
LALLEQSEPPLQAAFDKHVAKRRQVERLD